MFRHSPFLVLFLLRLNCNKLIRGLHRTRLRSFNFWSIFISKINACEYFFLLHGSVATQTWVAPAKPNSHWKFLAAWGRGRGGGWIEPREGGLLQHPLLSGNPVYTASLPDSRVFMCDRRLVYGFFASSFNGTMTGVWGKHSRIPQRQLWGKF